MNTFNEERAEEIKEELNCVLESMKGHIDTLGSIIREMDDSNAEAYLLKNLMNLVDRDGYGIMSYDLDLVHLIDRVDDHIEDDEEE